jgi:16S rRNA (guanine(1405)-N(7))-methyltransferase
MVKLPELVKALKAKKELANLDDSFVQQRIDKIFKSNNLLKKKFDASKDFAQFSRSKEYEELMKRIRKELRVVYGVFQQGDNRKKLLAELRTTKDPAEILATHKSTKERLPHYEDIYSKICSEIQPEVVIDLGCGMNPLAYHYFVQQGCKPKIIASDISKTDMEFLEECFKVLKIPGETKQLDLTKEYEELKAFKGDVTFLLKLLDSLEESHRHISYKIFDNIKTSWIVASFPTRSLGGKNKIATAGRTWFERLLKRKNLEWSTFSVENELFYIIHQ